MPHSREVRATSHDRHDSILVAALAADDLAGTDRDQALELTRTCADCALLHRDLRDLARATASAPPPIANPRRDFRLTPDDAARLRPAGWRRLADALSRRPSGLTRSLGVGLATLGLAGLLIGNVRIELGSSAAAPATTSGGATTGVERELDAKGDTGPLASAAPAPVQAGPDGVVAVPAASGATDLGVVGPVSQPANQYGAGGAVRPAASQLAAPRDASSGDLLASTEAATEGPLRPANLLFVAAIVIGIGLVAIGFRGRRSTG
jgi:hypothetical protein